MGIQENSGSTAFVSVLYVWADLKDHSPRKHLNLFFSFHCLIMFVTNSERVAAAQLLSADGTV